jgi:exportin-2 (importin alpha re-exporter)
MDHFEKSVSVIVSDYITHYLAQYTASPSDNWGAKDTALFLFSAIAIKSSTAQGGVTSTNLLVDVCLFWRKNCLEEFVEGKSHPVLQADYIRYIYVFRNQVRPLSVMLTKLTTEQLNAIFPVLGLYLQKSEFVVYTYAAVTLERILALKRDGTAVFTKTDLAPLLQDLLGSLFGLIERDPAPEKLAENDFLMKCMSAAGRADVGLMRVFTVARETMTPLVEVSTQHLVGILAEISKNPSNPRFNHYLFESIAALIRYPSSTLS